MDIFYKNQSVPLIETKLLLNFHNSYAPPLRSTRKEGLTYGFELKGPSYKIYTTRQVKQKLKGSIFRKNYIHDIEAIEVVSAQSLCIFFIIKSAAQPESVE